MKRPIKFASFHQSVFVPGPLGELGKTIPSPTKRTPDLKMYTDGQVLEISTSGHIILIPIANVVVMRVDVEAEVVAVESVKKTK